MNESDTISHGLTTSTNPVGIPLDADRGVAHDQPSLNTSDPHLFCNAIRGVGDDGVDVLLARMSNAARTMKELRNFWMERSAIEEEYAKRLAQLARMEIGKEEEIGELRNSIDALRLETDMQAEFHSQLAQQIRTDLEVPVDTFITKQQVHKKVYQAAIEKEHKQTREQLISEAWKKYEGDCQSVNSYTSQSTLVQDMDLEKIHPKLGRMQEVQVNAQFTKVPQETTMQTWEHDWNVFCDRCQDLEHERMEFMKGNMWAYANALSNVCVSDDESCENIRLALERLKPENELESFVRDYCTGNAAIPEPLEFVSHANTDAPSVSVNRASALPQDDATGTHIDGCLPISSYVKEMYDYAATLISKRGTSLRSRTHQYHRKLSKKFSQLKLPPSKEDY